LKSVIDRAVRKARAEEAAKTPKGKDDADLEQFLQSAMPVIKVVGCGGAGNNTVSRLHEMGVKGAELIAVNTDAQQLVYAPADRKILIGKRTLKGLGAGSDPRLGEQAAQEDADDIKKAIEGAHLVFITAGLGGGTGSGSAPVVAEIAREVGAIIIPNDKLLEIAPDLPINAAFKVSDEILANAIKGITEMITKPGLINLDFNDLKTVLAKGGPAVIGLGESQSDGAPEDRALEAVEDALASPLLDVDISEAERALVNVVGGADMTLKEAEMIAEAVQSKIHPRAHIIWGAMIDPEIVGMKLREFIDQSARIFRMAKKPTPEEFKRTAKITGLGITILGVLGFIIHMIVWFIQNGGQ